MAASICVTTSEVAVQPRDYDISPETETSPRQFRQSLKLSICASIHPLTLQQPPAFIPSNLPDRISQPESVVTESRFEAFDESESGQNPPLPISPPKPRTAKKVRFENKLVILEAKAIDWGEEEEEEEEDERTSGEDDAGGWPQIQHTMAISPPMLPFLSMPRFILIVFTLAFILPTLYNSPLFGKGRTPLGAQAGLIRIPLGGNEINGDYLQVEKRDDSITDVCKRWSQQAAVVNGTMYLYGGRLTTDASQTNNTWNNDFISLDLTKGWQISSPTLNGLPQPSGPPPVANGYLWNSYDSLFLYGGEFSDTPVTSPVPFSLWQYNIKTSKWIEYQDPTTTEGTNSDPGNQPVQRSAEGAGINIPSLGRGYYFGGHLDGYTTSGWSQSIPRVYLKSLIEYTFPGLSNPSVNGGKAAGQGGLWRNITEGGLQDSAGFTERADGVLVYVPGYGKEGIILGLAGGTNSTFTQMNVIDVYDIATSSWFKQATSGKTPDIRVNPCAVAASAADGSSTQVYMYGGQNLIPYGSQTQYDDMWILSIPSFTWIQVNTDNQSVPPARAGHSCSLWNSQMIVVGGYVGKDLSCDSPGIYVFNASSLTWQNAYDALSGGNDLNQQLSQQKDNTGLSGSYGYKVPKAVQSVIGGNDLGRATITAPALAATSGPLATGKPITYTVTQSNGAVVTETAVPSNPDNNSSQGRNIAAIVAGVIAGCLAILAAYLGFCAWVYRRQLALYKHHVAMSQRPDVQGSTGKLSGLAAFDMPQISDQTSNLAPGARVSGDGLSVHPSRSSHSHTNSASSATGLITATGYQAVPGLGTSSKNSSTEDLLAGQEPSFLGVVLNPRRNLRVINQD